MDGQTWLAQALRLTSSAASTPFDFGDANHWIGGTVKKIKLRARVNTKFSGSMTSLSIAWQDSADNSSYADTAVKLVSVLKAKLVAGADLLDVDLPLSGGAGQVSGSLAYPNLGFLRRYGQFYFTLNGGKAASSGAVDAWIDVF